MCVCVLTWVSLRRRCYGWEELARTLTWNHTACPPSPPLLPQSSRGAPPAMQRTFPPGSAYSGVRHSSTSLLSFSPAKLCPPAGCGACGSPPRPAPVGNAFLILVFMRLTRAQKLSSNPPAPAPGRAPMGSQSSLGTRRLQPIAAGVTVKRSPKTTQFLELRLGEGLGTSKAVS